jgi:succinate dehydrogenase / fumarate reductase flavoprotein subunit
MYGPKLKELIKKVEATRPTRISDAKKEKHFPLLSSEEGWDLMHRFHPDYIPGAKRELKAGPNKGQSVPNEFADLIEAQSLIDPADIDLETIDHYTDVLIIGGGGAGSSAALMAQENGAKVLLVTKLRHGDANTMMAEGGIQAATRPQDSLKDHFLDAMGGGHFTNDPKLVKALVHDGPEVIQWFEDLGVMLDKEKDGTLKTLHGGGTSRKRMHSAGDMSGAEIMRTLRDEVRDRKDIEVIEYSPAIELLMDDKGQCAGAILKNMETGKYIVARAKCTIIATGGFGRLHIRGYATTNHYGATADGLVMAYRAGCSLRFMEASQFHPTGVAFPEQNVGLLITEKFRGAGAQLLNIDGEQFVYPLETRDVESSAIIRECTEKGKGIKTPTGRIGVWLDSPMIEILKGEGTVQRDFPAIHRQFMRHGIDVSKQPMLVYPTLHYQNGGITINDHCETEIPDLYAAGEVTGGVHGTNRLMGNSLLDVTAYGRRAGIDAAKKAPLVELGKLTLEHIGRYHKALQKAGIVTERTSPMVLPNYVGKIA